MRSTVLPHRLRESPKPPSAAHTFAKLGIEEPRAVSVRLPTTATPAEFARLVISLPTKDRAVV